MIAAAEDCAKLRERQVGPRPVDSQDASMPRLDDRDRPARPHDLRIRDAGEVPQNIGDDFLRRATGTGNIVAGGQAVDGLLMGPDDAIFLIKPLLQGSCFGPERDYLC